MDKENLERKEVLHESTKDG